MMKKKPQTQELQSAYPEQPLENQKPVCEMSVTALSKDLMRRQQSDATQAPNLKDHILGPPKEPSWALHPMAAARTVGLVTA